MNGIAEHAEIGIRLLTVRQTAAMLGRMEQWVRRTLAKRIPTVRDGELRFDIHDINAYITKSKVTAVTGHKID